MTSRPFKVPNDMNDPMDIRPAIVTNWVKILMTFIDRIGFPITAFLLMWYLNLKLSGTIEKLNTTLVEIKQVLQIKGVIHG